jgi:hypothetical protein
MPFRLAGGEVGRDGRLEIVERVANEIGVKIKLKILNSTGGHGQALNSLKNYVKDIERDQASRPDVLIVAIDANCHGLQDRRKEILRIVEKVGIEPVCAVPDPHIERWLLIDPAAFKQVFGKGSQLPNYKCEKDKYKKLLIDAIRECGVIPSLGGIEFADDIIEATDIDRASGQDESFGQFCSELKSQFKTH